MCPFIVLRSPDIYVSNVDEFERGLGGNAASGLSQLLQVSPDGTVLSSQQTRVIMSCPMNFAQAPFDTQHCPFSLGLYSQTADKVRLTWKPFTVPIDSADRCSASGWGRT